MSVTRRLTYVTTIEGECQAMVSAMSVVHQAAVRNQLLRDLNSADFQLLSPHMWLEKHYTKDVIAVSDAVVSDLFFPEGGVVSVNLRSHGRGVSIGLIGKEGVVGAVPNLLGADRSPFEYLIQVPGEHYRIETRPFTLAVEQSKTLRARLLRHVQDFVFQLAETALSNACSLIDVRLARWLAMCQDRMQGAEMLPITHDALASMLGVRRASVTEALHVLEGRGLVKSKRGEIKIVDRDVLIAFSRE